MPSRRAACSCGQLALQCEGEPDRVVACNCTWCQRRTGAPFGVGEYYHQGQVKVTGEYSNFSRAGGAGRTLTNLAYQGRDLFITDSETGQILKARAPVPGRPLAIPHDQGETA